MLETIRLRPHHFDMIAAGLYPTNRRLLKYSTRVLPGPQSYANPMDFVGVDETTGKKRYTPAFVAFCNGVARDLVYGETKLVIPVISFDDICERCKAEGCQEYEPAICSETDEAPTYRTTFFRSLRLKYFYPYPAGLVLKAMQDSVKLFPGLLYGFELNTNRI